METATAIAIASLLISVAAVAISGSQALSSRRSARAAEASAASSEESAVAAVRSADAAERSADIQAQALTHEERRAQREAAAEDERLAPKLSPVHNHPVGTFNYHLPHGPLSAHFVNDGVSPAVIESAELKHLNGFTSGGLEYYEPSPVSGGVQSRLRLPVESRVMIQFDVHPNDVLQGNDAPVIFIEFRSDSGGYRAKVQCPLLRAGATAQSRPQWQAGDLKIVRIESLDEAGQ